MVALMRDLRHEESVAYPELAEYIDYLDLEGKRPKTLYGYTREIAMLLRQYPETPFAGFTSEQLNAALRLKPPAGRHITRSIWAGWFEWGVEQDKLVSTPMRKVAKPKKLPRRPIDTYTDAEIVALQNLPSPDGALCTLMFTTGLRKSECRKLRRSDIDLARARLAVIDGKGGKDRVVPMPDEAVRAVAELDLLEGLAPTDYLWHTNPGGRGHFDRSRPASDTTFDRWWSGSPASPGRREVVGVCAKAGVRRLTIHKTRHTYGHRLREKGIDLELRKVLMGHEDIKTTDHYYGTVTVDDAAARLAEVW
jgi:integrase/recombinase XerD